MARLRPCACRGTSLALGENDPVLGFPGWSDYFGDASIVVQGT